MIYNFHKKKFIKKKINYLFPAKCNTFFLNDEINNNNNNNNHKYKFSIFISGGLNKKQRIVYDKFTKEQVFDLQNLAKQRFQSLKNFNEIKITYDIFDDKFDYEIKELPAMNYARNSHSFIKFEDYFIVISGSNTKTCEVFSFKFQRWSDLPSLPSYCLNSSLAVFDNYLYCFCGSTTVSPFDSIYKLSLNYLEKFINNEKGFKDSLKWEEVRFFYSSKNFNLRKSTTKLRRGMAPLIIGNHTLFLFGGFDNDNIYDDVLEVTFLEKEAEVKRQNEKKEKEMDIKVAANAKNKIEIKENVNSNNIFEKSEKEIEENLIVEMNNKKYINNDIIAENEYNKNEDMDMEENYNDNDNDNDIDIDNNELYELKIEKKLTTLPNKTFFNSNISLVNNTILLVDGFNNAIEYNIENNQFCYFT